MRAEDGLALSSRNGYLSSEQRAKAPRLHATLWELRDGLEAGAEASTTLEHGLALSSRNGYLSPEQRAIAPRLYATLCELREGLEAGSAPPALLEQGRTRLEEAGFEPDYLELRAADLGPATTATREAVLLAAARLGTTRLIDNLTLTLPR